MFYSITQGRRAPDQKWSGDKPEAGGFASCWIIERTCTECGAATRKLRSSSLRASLSPEAQGVLDIPELLLGSTSADSGELAAEFKLTTWGGRVVGYAIVNPTTVVVQSGSDAPRIRGDSTRSWVKTHHDEGGSEFVLVDGAPQEHALRVVQTEGTCPRCRQAEPFDAVLKPFKTAIEDWQSANPLADWVSHAKQDALAVMASIDRVEAIGGAQLLEAAKYAARQQVRDCIKDVEVSQAARDAKLRLEEFSELKARLTPEQVTVFNQIVTQACADGLDELRAAGSDMGRLLKLARRHRGWLRQTIPSQDIAWPSEWPANWMTASDPSED